MNESAQRIINIAKAEVGTKEKPENIQKYSPAVPGLEWSQGQPWCATFVSWCAMQAGLEEIFPSTASCDVGGAWFKSRDQWSSRPAVGSQVFYGYPHDLNHTGIVYDFDDDYIYTIEGNTNGAGSREGDGVYLKYRVRNSYIIGYGHPAYPSNEEEEMKDEDWTKMRELVREEVAKANERQIDEIDEGRVENPGKQGPKAMSVGRLLWSIYRIVQRIENKLGNK